MNEEESNSEVEIETKMKLHLSDWRQAIRNPPSYRIGNSTVRMQTQFIYVVIFAGVAILLYFYFFGLRAATPVGIKNEFLDSEHQHNLHYLSSKKLIYNATYPLTPPLMSEKGITYKFYVVTDLDQNSKVESEKDTWKSILRQGFLTWNPKTQQVVIEWAKDEDVELKSTISCGGRGMELSELVIFNGKLYTVDDRTGIIYQIYSKDGSFSKNKVIPWVILADGNGKETKGFKSEWATVKDGFLYVGGLGKEWTTAKGELVHYNPMWVKRISPSGEVEHLDWRTNYEMIKAKCEIKSPGYVIYEAVNWSALRQAWYFLPRRASNNRYDEVEDEAMGTNLLVSANEDFQSKTLVKVGEVVPTHGFSSFKFVPGTDDQLILALKSEENKGQVASYIMVFDTDGKIIFPETKIGNYKFEGLEFV
ncbi:hypothetical protein CHUAL_003104 [Chamberlinius hualienensis]